MEDRVLPIKCKFFAQFKKNGYQDNQNYQKNGNIGLNFMSDLFSLHSNLLSRSDPFRLMILAV